MASSIPISTYQALVSNILNKYDNSAVYNSTSGAWTLKNTTGVTVLSRTDAGA